MRILIVLSLSISIVSTIALSAELSGELKKWHKVTLTFEGPQASETDEYNPFRNYRLNVLFKHKASEIEYLVPGYFAADGDAANSSATSGDKWRVHFRPDRLGEWIWAATFRKGAWVAISDRPASGESGDFMDGASGDFEISPSDKVSPDFRARGRLDFVGEPFLRFAETREYFVKAGPDAPENFLSYADFDGDFHDDGHKDHMVKTWEPHLGDWSDGDPTWGKGRGKAIIGALNYLASKGMNSFSFLTLNIEGDDQNVYPYINYDTYDRFDVSKLDQWEIVFSHGQSLGLFLHFKTQEMENQGLLDGGGVGYERKLYYRELIARFGHHLALNWNMGEENGEWVTNHITPPQTTPERLSMARYFAEHDPYKHHIVIHNGISYDDLFGPYSDYTGASVQTHLEDYSQVHRYIVDLRVQTKAAGKIWAIACDEPGNALINIQTDDKNPTHDIARQNGLWGAMMGGAWGTEWYFGYQDAHSDFTCESYRVRDSWWNQCKHMLDFFEKVDLPYQDTEPADHLIGRADGYCLAKTDHFYFVYAKNPSVGVTIDMYHDHGDFEVRWYDPRNGGDFVKGSVETINAVWTTPERPANFHSIGLPPSKTDNDWVAVIRRVTPRVLMIDNH